MDIDAIETSLSVKFPATHRKALTDPSDPIHAARDFLVGESPHELLRLNVVSTKRSRTVNVQVFEMESDAAAAMAIFPVGRSWYTHIGCFRGVERNAGSSHEGHRG